MKRTTFAIDSQISPDTAGGTETALLSLVSAIGRSQTRERFLLLGLRSEGHKLKTYMGPNQELKIWPGQYRWHPAAGSDAPGPRARKWMKRLGPFGRAVLPARSLWRRLFPADKPLGARRVAQELYGVSAVHFPYPLHFDTSVPFVYEPWGLPHHHIPEMFGADEAAWMDGLFRRGCERAAVVVTATRWVKHDIAERYKIDPKKIAVIPRLPEDMCGGTMELEYVPDLPHRFAFFPAMTWPSKNHLGLIEAVARLKRRHDARLDVVCTGRIHQPHWPKIQAALKTAGVEEQFHFLGTVPIARVHALYRQAAFLIFPSLFEGLGLPVLEAFQHGLPVVAAKSACVPEVAGDAAILFDPHDADDFDGALLKAMREPQSLAAQREKAKRRLSEGFFAGPELARRFIACYRKAAGEKLSEDDQALWRELTR